MNVDEFNFKLTEKDIEDIDPNRIDFEKDHGDHFKVLEHKEGLEIAEPNDKNTHDKEDNLIGQMLSNANFIE